MIRKIVPVVAAACLSVTGTGGAVAATLEQGSPAALGNAAIAAAQPGKSPNSRECKKDKGLFDRLGGFFGIAAVVNNFSDAILVNPVLNANPALAAWTQNEAATRLPGLKFLRTMWIASMVGGPIKYTGQPLEQAHERFNMTPAEFAEVGSEIVKALQAAGVAQADIDQAVCIYQTSMDEVVSETDALEARSPPKE
ncbi:MAG TPA: group 1 truncated hemoglobin [Sphingomicrobium sp.]|nr:group 1 truncated hemoglobin [Sphingomicrobium sp.]